MMYSEFLKISGQEISFKQYSEIIEPMYNAVENMTKFEFVDLMMPTIKAMAKKNAAAREAEEIRNQKLVFISNGSKTPNGAYFYGVFAKLVRTEIEVATGKKTVKVRELTDDEEMELAKHQDLNLNYGRDYVVCDSKVRVGETQKVIDCLDRAVIKWVK